MQAPIIQYRSPRHKDPILCMLEPQSESAYHGKLPFATLDLTVASGVNAEIEKYTCFSEKEFALLVNILPGDVCALILLEGSISYKVGELTRTLVAGMADLCIFNQITIPTQIHPGKQVTLCLVRYSLTLLKAHENLHQTFRHFVSRATGSEASALTTNPILLTPIFIHSWDQLLFTSAGGTISREWVDLQAETALLSLLDTATGQNSELLAENNVPNDVQRAMDGLELQLLLNLGEKQLLPTLAAQVNMSVPRLSTYFRKEFGASVHHHRLNVRLDLAEQWLLHTHWPIKQIAAQIGYAHQSTFTAVFKKQKGLSPSMLRKQKFSS